MELQKLTNKKQTQEIQLKEIQADLESIATQMQTLEKDKAKLEKERKGLENIQKTKEYHIKWSDSIHLFTTSQINLKYAV